MVIYLDTFCLFQLYYFYSFFTSSRNIKFKPFTTKYKRGQNNNNNNNDNSNNINMWNDIY